MKMMKVSENLAVKKYPYDPKRIILGKYDLYHPNFLKSVQLGLTLLPPCGKFPNFLLFFLFEGFPKGRHQKTAERVKLASFTLTPSPTN